ncbi:MAG TPA: molybdenum ABC transporter ATP-binding protein [Candidatus Binatia bacterium]
MLLQCRVPLAGFDLDVDIRLASQVTAVFGPSGAGKTSLLEAVAGLRPIASGEIEIGGRTLFSSAKKIDLAPRARSLGYVPQEASLFPHLTVKKNILFGAGRRGGYEGAADIGFEPVVALLEIGHLLERPVGRISGGESQRVALARALLSRPRLLLLDEPLAALDIGLRERILPYLKRVRDEFRIPMIYVTHNPVEVLSLADGVIVLSEGRLAAQGAPREILTSGAVLSRMERDQLENVFEAVLIDSDAEGGRSRVRLAAGPELFVSHTPAAAGRAVQIGIRGDDILVATKAPEGISAGNILRGTIRTIETSMGQAILQVDAGAPFYVRLTPPAVARLGLAAGGEVFL